MRHLFSLVATLVPFITRITAAPLDGLAQRFVDEKIPNAWIVQLKGEPSSQNLDEHLSWLSSVTQEVTGFAGAERKYNFAGFVGYSGKFDDSTVQQIRARPEVALVEQDGVVNADRTCVNQTLPMPGLWGLGRISFRPGGSKGVYVYNDTSPYCNSRTGPPTAYVIDSGVFTKHKDFGRRATHLWKAESSWSPDDKCGHGTHVAGTIIGKTYGVAKHAIVFSVKVLEGTHHGFCSGSWAGVIAGIDYAYKHAYEAGKVPLSVINLSLGGGFNAATNNAVQKAVAGGLTVVVSAGNAGENACNFSPASAPDAITVAASDINDELGPFSNYGCCVDIHAPGVEVLSTWIANETATTTFSGTSMAAPHISGLILYRKCLTATSRTPRSDKRELVKQSVLGVIKGKLCAQGSSQKCCSPNLLANNGGCT